MRRNYKRSNNEVRYLNAKYAGKCAACGGAIKAGELVAWDPARRQIEHLGNYDPSGRYTANSAMCASVLSGKFAAAGYGDPGEDAADRWSETHR
jgi:hypothetical protein